MGRNNQFAAIMWGYNKNIINGIGDRTYFGTEDSITRGQTATILYKFMGSPKIGKNVKNPFSDVKTSDGYYKAIMWAVENKIVNGYSDGTYRPKENCTRGQLMTILYKIAGKPAVSATKSVYSDVKTTDGYFKSIMWGYENGIYENVAMNGTKFGAKTACTRADFVTFVYNYNLDAQIVK